MWISLKQLAVALGFGDSRFCPCFGCGWLVWWVGDVVYVSIMWWMEGTKLAEVRGFEGATTAAAAKTEYL